jgi:hypothetical protein
LIKLTPDDLGNIKKHGSVEELSFNLPGKKPFFNAEKNSKLVHLDINTSDKFRDPSLSNKGVY